jgi:hypothetical protein
VGVALLSAIGLASSSDAAQAPPPPQAEQPAPNLVTLHLVDGTIVVGEVLSDADGKIRVRTQHLGELTIDSGAIKDRGPLDEEAPEALAAHKAEAAAPPEHPKVPSWTRSITTSTALVSAPFEQGQVSTAVPELTGAALRLPGAQKSMQLGFTLRHAGPKQAFSIGGSGMFVDAEPLGRMSEGITADIEYSRVLSERSYFMASTLYRRDEVRHIDNSFAQLGGIGYKLVHKPRVKFDVILGSALLNENKDTPYDDTWQPQAGVVEAMVIQFNPRSAVTHRFVYRGSFRDQAVWSIESFTGIQAAITSKFSIVSGLTWNYDNVLGEAVTPVPANALFPGSPALSLTASLKTFRQFTSGIQFAF